MSLLIRITLPPIFLPCFPLFFHHFEQIRNTMKLPFFARTLFGQRQRQKKMLKLNQNVDGKLLNEFVQPQKIQDDSVCSGRFAFYSLRISSPFHFFSGQIIHAVIVDGIEVENTGKKVATQKRQRVMTEIVLAAKRHNHPISTIKNVHQAWGKSNWMDNMCSLWFTFFLIRCSPII